MSFGSKKLDDAFDRWVTRTPEEVFGEDEELEDDNDLEEEYTYFDENDRLVTKYKNPYKKGGHGRTQK